MLLKMLIRVIRAPFFTAVIVPTLLGTAIAWHKGHFHLGYFLLALFGAISTNAATNTANDYFDHLSGDDEYNRELTPFSGGSRVIQEEILSPWQMLALSGAFYAIVIAIGLYLSYVRGWTLLYLGAAGVFISLFYNPWIAYFGHGLGELVTGLACGPITVCGAYFVQAQRITPEAIWASLPVGFLIALILYINEFPDYEADKAASKRTIVVQLGRQRAVPGYIIIIAAAYVSILAGILMGLLPYTTLLAFLTLPLAYQGVQGVRRFYADTPQLIPTNALTIQVHLATGLLLSLAYVIDKALWF
ncbi:MAG: prenyltransferase [Anaerolineae bacterium]